MRVNHRHRFAVRASLARRLYDELADDRMRWTDAVFWLIVGSLLSGSLMWMVR